MLKLVRLTHMGVEHKEETAGMGPEIPLILLDKNPIVFDGICPSIFIWS